MLATCTCSFAPQTEATHLTVVVTRMSIDTQPLCLSWHIGMWVSLLVACSFSSVCCSLALQPSCSVQLDHLYSGPSPPQPQPLHSTQNRQNLHPRPTIHSLLQQNQNDCKLTKQGRLDLFCTTKCVFLFSLPLPVCDFTPCLMALSCAVCISSFCDIEVAAHSSPCLFMDFDLFFPSFRCLLTPHSPDRWLCALKLRSDAPVLLLQFEELV